jgi:hypothetical protein
MDLNTGATSGGSTFDYSAQQYSYQTPVTQTTTTTTSTYTTGGDFGATYSTGADLSSFATGATSSFATGADLSSFGASTTQSYGVSTGAQPVFKLLRQGAGISSTEQQGIVKTAMEIYQAQRTPLSNNTANLIKKRLGGDWIVIVYAHGKPIDFNMTCVQGNDYMYFTLDSTAYQVCRLR